MTSSQPLISVIMPVHNAGQYLLAAIESILKQKDILFEFIIVDDHSTDSAILDLPENIINDPRIKLIASPETGVVATMRHGYLLSRGDYIARMDADDIALPERLSKQLYYLQANPEIGIAGGQVKIISDSAVAEGFQYYESWLNRLCTSSEIENELFVESPIPNPTAFFRRHVYEQLDGYQETEWAEDYDLWLRAHAAGIKMGKPQGVVLHWREHPQRLTHNDSRYASKLFMKARAHYLSKSHYLNQRKAVIWGTGPTGLYFHDVLRKQNTEIVAFFEVNPRRIGGIKRNLPVLHFDAANRFPEALIIGAVGSRGAREKMRQALCNMGKREGIDFLFAA